MPPTVKPKAVGRTIASTTHLIDAVIRQTMALVAHLATAEGQRAKVAQLESRVFLDLVVELERLGLGQKVIADMFGLALRTYQRKRQRLADDVAADGRSLWEAVFEFVVAQAPVSRDRILERFRWDDEQTVRGVLNDLVESGLLSRDGYAASTTYDVAATPGAGDAIEVSASIVWGAMHRMGPSSISRIAAELSMSESALTDVLDRLCADDRVRRLSNEQGDDVYIAEDYLIPFGSTAGWAGAVFDHYQALVGAVTAKLRGADRQAHLREAVGGSTFHFDLSEDHPHRDEVVGLLAEFRQRASTLRRKVTEYNESEQCGPTDHRVVVYVGQHVVESDEETP